MRNGNVSVGVLDVVYNLLSKTPQLHLLPDGFALPCDSVDPTLLSVFGDQQRDHRALPELAEGPRDVRPVFSTRLDTCRDIDRKFLQKTEYGFSIALHFSSRIEVPAISQEVIAQHATQTS